MLDESLDRLPPADREILFRRFFEERSFREIAESSGSTEAACKMRLKRALGKLNGWLTGRGVTLSAVALATCLTAEFSKAAPAAVTAALPANAIAASPGVGAATILTNTLNTMSTAKTAGLAAAAIILLGSIPIAIQHGQAKQLKTEIADLEKRADAAPTGTGLPSIGTVGSGSADPTPVRTFLEGLEKPLGADELITQLATVMMGRDQSQMIRIMLPLAGLTPEEYRRLFDEVKASDKSEEMKSMAIQMLSMVGPDNSEGHAEALDRQLSDGVSSLNLAATLAEWAKEDPDAAIAWFNGRKGSPEFLGTAVDDSPQSRLFGGLVAGLARVDPERAQAMLAEASGQSRVIAAREAVVSLSLGGAEGRAKAIEIVRGIESQNERAISVQSAVSGMAFRGMMAEAVEFANAAGLDDNRLARSIVAAAITRGENPAKTFEQQATWALENAPEDVRDELVGELVSRNRHAEEEQVTAWVDSLPEGAERDAGLEAQSQVLTQYDRIDEALQRAEMISDPVRRGDAVMRAFVWMNSRNPGAATRMAEKHGYNLDEILGR